MSLHTEVNMVMKPRFPCMSRRENRLYSFTKCPQKNFDTEDFVDAGLFYSSKDNIIKCFWCLGILKNWKLDDDPFERHSKEYPECAFASRYYRAFQHLKKSKFKYSNFKYTSITCKNDVSQNVSSENPLTCGICYTEEKQIVFETCGHVYCCASCSEKLTYCPVCRSIITKRMKIYIA